MEQLRGDTWLSGQYYAGNASSCVSKAKRCKMLFLYKQPSASKRQCPGEALLLVVKVVLVVFLTYPNDIENIELTKQTWL